MADRNPRRDFLYEIAMTVIIAALFLLAVGTSFIWFHWTTLAEEAQKDPLRAIQVAGTVALGVIGVPLLAWRGFTGHRQANAQTRQVRASESVARNERFQRAAEMLASNAKEERLAAIFVLSALKTEDPDTYHRPISRVFAACLSDTSPDPETRAVETDYEAYDTRFTREEDALMFEALGQRSDEVVASDLADGFRPKLVWGRIPIGTYSNLRFDGFFFYNVKVGQMTRFDGCSFKDASWQSCDLRQVQFGYCPMKETSFNLSRVEKSHFIRNPDLYAWRLKAFADHESFERPFEPIFEDWESGEKIDLSKPL